MPVFLCYYSFKIDECLFKQIPERLSKLQTEVVTPVCGHIGFQPFSIYNPHTSKQQLVGADQRICPQPNHETKGKDALTNISIDGMRYAQKFHKIILKIFQNTLMPSTFCFILNQILRAFPAVGGIFID